MVFWSIPPRLTRAGCFGWNFLYATIFYFLLRFFFLYNFDPCCFNTRQLHRTVWFSFVHSNWANLVMTKNSNLFSNSFPASSLQILTLAIVICQISVCLSLPSHHLDHSSRFSSTCSPLTNHFLFIILLWTLLSFHYLKILHWHENLTTFLGFNSMCAVNII